MKKMIVLLTTLLAVNCWAGMPEELFKLTNTFDITALDTANSGDIFGATRDAEQFKAKTTAYFMEADNSIILKHWTQENATTACTAVIYSGTVYVICIEDKTVIIKEIK